MSQLLIYKASAGSGKTYTLTGEYIKLLKFNADNYKRTLAVTFTNKATAEMKERILKRLHEASKSNNLVAAGESKRLLNLILNDYSNFNISTIDSFFQSILRSFAIELNLDNSFRLEMDSKWIIEKATDLVLAESDNKLLKEWMNQFASEKITKGLSWNPKSDIELFGYQLEKEAFQRLSSEEFLRIADLDNIYALRKDLKELVSEFNGKLLELLEKALLVLDSNQISYENNSDIYLGKSRSPLKALYTSRKDISLLKPETIVKLKSVIDNNESFFAKTERDKYSGVEAHFFLELTHFIDYYTTYSKSATSAQLVEKKLNVLGVIGRLKYHYDSICKEEEIFPISNTQNFIHKIIDNLDAPFIYEKAGSFYNNFMIDEFQDTSQLQWINLKPLVENSLASDNFSMVVGDVKQAIYRFRNSDWNLLNSQINNDFIEGNKTISLTSNYRSDKNIIEFNNTVFPFFASLIAESLTVIADSPEYGDKIISIFNDTVQELGNEKHKAQGYVEVRFLTDKMETINDDEADDAVVESDSTDADEVAKAEKNGFYINSLKQTAETIKRLKANGDDSFRYQDICILVRTTAESALVSKYLLSENIPLLNTKALTLGKSQMIMWIIASIRFTINQHSKLMQYEVNHHFKSLHNYSDDELLSKLIALSQKPLFEMIEGIITLASQEVQDSQAIYIQAFIDQLTLYYKDYNPSMHEFLDWWDDKGVKKAINTPANLDAVQLMTIHGSKGLQFDVVIIPFAHSPFEKGGRNSDVIWVKPLVAPYNRLPLVPLPYQKTLLNSDFKDLYLLENMNRLVDSLNLLYVALTRPVKALYIFSLEPKIKKDGSQFSTSNSYGWLFNKLRVSNELTALKSISIADDVITIGDESELFIKRESSENKNDHSDDYTDVALSNCRTYDYEGRLNVKLEEESYLSLTERDSKRKRGTQMHKVFEYITYQSDVEKAIDKAIREGIILPTERAELLILINDRISQPKTKEWFDRKNIVKAEATILTPHSSNSKKQMELVFDDVDALETNPLAKTYRPDRIIISPENNVFVIDYKFSTDGIDKNSKGKYIKQLQTYVDLISAMGYKKVEGYIWYVYTNEIVTV